MSDEPAERATVLETFKPEHRVVPCFGCTHRADEHDWKIKGSRGAPCRVADCLCGAFSLEAKRVL